MLVCTESKEQSAEDDPSGDLVLLRNEIPNVMHVCDLTDKRMVPDRVDGKCTDQNGHRSELTGPRGVQSTHTGRLNVVVDNENKQSHQQKRKDE